MIYFNILQLVAFVLIISKYKKLLPSLMHPVNLLMCAYILNYMVAYNQKLVGEDVLFIVIVSQFFLILTVLVDFFKSSTAKQNKTTQSQVKFENKKRPSKISLIVLIGFAFLTYVAFHFALNTVGLSFFEYLLNLSKYYIEIRTGTAWILMVIPFVSVASLVYFALDYELKILRFILVFIFVGILLIMTGTRGGVVVYALQVYAVMYMKADLNVNSQHIYLNLNKIFIFLIGPMVVASFLYSTSTRLDVDFEGYADGTFLVDFDKARNIEKFQEKYGPSMIGQYHGATLLDILDIFMPRYFYPNKAVSTYGTRDLNPDAAEYGSNDTFGILTLAYMNFGIVGVAIESILFSMIYTSLYRRVYYREDYHPYFIVRSSICIGFFYILINGGLLTHFIFLLVLQLLFARMLIKICKVKF